jgi:multidrug transporter EmrE-like cation transporter
MPLPYVLTFATVILLAAGQVLFKMTAGRMSGKPIIEALGTSSVLVPFAAALAIYAVATLLWILALRDLPLGRAYFLMSLTFLIVPTISVLVFSEHFTPGFAVGGGLIVAGILVTQLWN